MMFRALFIASIASMGLSLFAAEPELAPPMSLISDGDMEMTAPAGWLDVSVPELVIGLDQEVKATGAGSLKIANPGKRTKEVVFSCVLPERQMDAIDVALSYRGIGKSMSLAIVYQDDAGNDYTSRGFPKLRPSSTGGDWQSARFRSTPPDEATKLVIKASLSGRSSCWVDDVVFEEVDLAPPTELDRQVAEIWSIIKQPDGTFKLDDLTVEQSRIFERGVAGYFSQEISRRQIGYNRFYMPKLNDYVFHEWSPDFWKRRMEDPDFKVTKQDVPYLFVLRKTIDNSTGERNRPHIYRKPLLKAGEMMPDYYLPILRPGLRDELVAADDLMVPRYEPHVEEGLEVPWEVRLFCRKQSKYRYYHENKGKKDYILITDDHAEDPDYFRLYDFKKTKRPSLILFGSYC